MTSAPGVSLSFFRFCLSGRRFRGSRLGKRRIRGVVQQKAVLCKRCRRLRRQHSAVRLDLHAFHKGNLQQRFRQAGGSGLGLSIVRELVQRNYGSIEVRSEVGKGTRFMVVFPYFEVEGESENAE